MKVKFYIVPEWKESGGDESGQLPPSTAMTASALPDMMKTPPARTIAMPIQRLEHG